MRPTSTRRGLFAAALATFAALGLSASNADAGYTTKTFGMYYSNQYGSPQLFGSVQIEANDTAGTLSGLGGNRVRFTVTAINVYGSGGAPVWASFGFNTVSSLTLTPGGNLQLLSGSGTNFDGVSTGKNQDGFGNFEQVLEWKGTGSATSTIKFEITGLSATNATIANFTQFTTGGNTSTSGKKIWAFAGHVKGDGVDPTHFIGAGDSDGGDDDVDIVGELEEVPAPPAVILAVMGVGLFGFVGRRLRRQTPAVA